MSTKRKFGWLTAGLLTAGLAVGGGSVGAATSYVNAKGDLRDFQLQTDNATDGASAELWAVASGGSTAFRVFFTGLDPDAAGSRFGVHIHVGPCVAGNGTAAGPHYNSNGGPATTSNEVWLDFTVRAGGYGYATTTVPFVIPAGAAQSMVVHVLPTAPGGAAGARQACLPVSFGLT